MQILDLDTDDGHELEATIGPAEQDESSLTAADLEDRSQDLLEQALEAGGRVETGLQAERCSPPFGVAPSL